MAAEARAESPAPAAPPLPVPAPAVASCVVACSASPEKRVLLGDGGGKGRPEPKRRRACVPALDSVPCAVPQLVDADGASFSFQHVRGGFVALETTPKFGSFNPPPVALATKPPPPPRESSPEEDGVPAASARSEGEGKDGNSQLVGQQQTT